MGKKRTALYDEHLLLGGKIVDFGGWELPVQYSGLTDEHLNCRSNVGIFDVSHMGEIQVSGLKSLDFVNFLVTNDVSKISDLQAQYTALCNKDGGIIDDLVIYRRNSENLLLVVNASNVEKDFTWIQSILNEFRSCFPDVTLVNQSAQWTQIALQGPKAQSVLAKLTSLDLSKIKTYWFQETTLLGNIPSIIARTGYTGEDGFEIYVPWEMGPQLWTELLKAGKALGIKPCGLGARDTLRLEMKYALYGHELSETSNPLETGLGWVTRLDKSDFIGKDAIIALKTAGVKKALVGLEYFGKGIPRQGYLIFAKDKDLEVGVVTSGTQSPTSKKAIAIAFIEKALSSLGTELRIQVRGEYFPATVVSTPFIKRNS